MLPLRASSKSPPFPSILFTSAFWFLESVLSGFFYFIFSSNIAVLILGTRTTSRTPKSCGFKRSHATWARGLTSSRALRRPCPSPTRTRLIKGLISFRLIYFFNSPIIPRVRQSAMWAAQHRHQRPRVTSTSTCRSIRRFWRWPSHRSLGPNFCFTRSKFVLVTRISISRFMCLFLKLNEKSFHCNRVGSTKKRKIT